MSDTREPTSKAGRPLHDGSGWHLDGARRSLWSGALLATAVFTIVDQTVLHLILHWHHLYDLSTPGVALLADGLFQAVGLIALVGAGFLYADLRRWDAWRPLWQAAGLFLGLAGLGLFDEIVVHKVLAWHQIHYGADVWKYDAVAGLCIVSSALVGVVVLRKALRADGNR